MSRPEGMVFAPAPSCPRLGDLARIVGLFALTRLLLMGAGVAAWDHQIDESTWRGRGHDGIRYALAPDRPFVDMWTRWDSWEYEEIARKGYWYDFRHEPQPYGTVACFPLYPLAIRAVGRLLGGHYVAAGLVVSNLSAIIGFWLLFGWTTRLKGRPAAWMAVASAITFPPGLFWSALYPQSLFFCLSVAALMLAQGGRIALASLCGMAVTATRLEGIAIVPALLALHLAATRGRVGVRVLWVAVAPLGLVLYMAFLYHEWGDPLLFLKVQALFGRRATNPLWTLVLPWTKPGGLADFRVWLTYLTGALLVLGHVAKVPLGALLYGWTLFVIPLCTGNYESSYRIHLVNVPIFLAMGLASSGRGRRLGWAVVALFAALEAAMMFGWVAGYRLT